MTDIAYGINTITEGAAYLYQDGVNTHMTTQEQIFSPIIVRKGGSSQMGFQTPRISPAMDSGGYAGMHLGPTSSELNPYFSQFGGGDGSEWMHEVDFHCVANDGTDEAEVNLRKVDREKITRVHTTGIRGPLMVAGWGSDLADKPVPGKGGSGMSAFTFDSAAIGNRTLWKTGPVDLKWDYERKVWSGGPQILMGVAMSAVPAGNPCAPAAFPVSVFRGPNQTVGPESDQWLNEIITCYNYDPSLSQDHVPGWVFVVAVRINYRWVPIWVGCPEREDYEDPETKLVTPPGCVANVPRG